MVVEVTTKVLFQDCVNAFGLFIGLWVECCRERDLYCERVAEGGPKVEGEGGAAVGND